MKYDGTDRLIGVPGWDVADFKRSREDVRNGSYDIGEK